MLKCQIVRPVDVKDRNIAKPLNHLELWNMNDLLVPPMLLPSVSKIWVQINHYKLLEGTKEFNTFRDEPQLWH
jgi:hypothetical protein